jgi:hypothetical protein
LRNKNIFKFNMLHKYALIALFFTFFTVAGKCQNQDSPLPIDSAYTEQNLDSLENQDEDYQPPSKKSQFEEALAKYHQETLETKNFDETSWKKAKEGLDYTIEKEKDLKPKDIKAPNSTFALALIGFLKCFFIVGALGVLVYLIAHFISEGNVFGRKSRRIDAPSVEIDLEHIEENLQESEFDPLIRQAIATKQFSLAIRLYYLASIKELSLAGKIQWKKDKTNREYVREMRPHRLFEPFKNRTAIFEKVWYGDSVLDEAGFTMIQPAFQDLLAQSRTIP